MLQTKDIVKICIVIYSGMKSSQDVSKGGFYILHGLSSRFMYILMQILINIKEE